MIYDYEIYIKQLKIAIESLEFYGGTECYSVVCDDGKVDESSEEIPGNKAREALKLIRGEK